MKVEKDESWELIGKIDQRRADSRRRNRHIEGRMVTRAEAGRNECLQGFGRV